MHQSDVIKTLESGSYPYHVVVVDKNSGDEMYILVFANSMEHVPAFTKLLLERQGIDGEVISVCLMRIHFTILQSIVAKSCPNETDEWEDPLRQ